MSTYVAKPQSVKREWFVVDATGLTLGRLATQIAIYLRGKHKAIYTPHVDTGDYIVVINSKKIKVTGKKTTDKVYHSHTGYIGGLKTINYQDLMAKNPTSALEIAVKGMLPKGPLGRAMFKKLKVFADNEHSHSAQQPSELVF